MLVNFFKKQATNDVSLESTPHGEEEVIHLTYVKVPQTLEMRRRQYEENLREKYNIPKEKSGQLL